MTVDILIFQHSEGSPPGSTLEGLAQVNTSGNPPSYHIHFWGKDSVENLNTLSFQSLLILGGPQNVDEENQYPWLRQEKLMIQKALQENKPILGICLGGQLIAEALGARVARHKHSEVGWHTVDFFSIQKKALIPTNLTQLDVFQFHSYFFETPINATLIATNSITPNQGFVYKQNVIGLQFHPEATKNWILECCNEIENSTQLRGDHVQSSSLIQAQLQKQDQLQQWYFTLLKNWMGNF